METNNTCKWLLLLNNDFQAISTCIENHVQTLDENTKKIEKEFNKIKDKIWCNWEHIPWDNILNSINEIKISNDKIKKVIVWNNDNNNDKIYNFFHSIFLIIMIFWPMFYWVYLTYNYNPFIKNNISYFVNYTDKVVITFTSVIFWFFLALYQTNKNNNWNKKNRTELAFLCILFLIYLLMWFIMYNQATKELNILNNQQINI